MGAQGTTTVDFGAAPGGTEATVDVSGQTGFTSTNLVEAWLFPVATGDHGVDEHLLEDIDVIAYFKVNGTLTIYATCRVGKAIGQFTVAWVWN